MAQPHAAWRWVRPAAVAAFAVQAWAAPGIPVAEYKVKAAYLYNLAKYVEWPPEAFADAAAPLTIGVLGEDPFGPVLEAVTRGKTVGGRPVSVARYDDPAAAGACQVLFLSASEEARWAALLARLRGRPVLTVGEEQPFLRAGGMVALRVEEDRVRFDVNAGAARRAGLKLSAQLLKLAGEVR